MYAEIAVENYYHAKDAYDRLKEMEYDCGETGNEIDKLDKYSVISIVFSAAAIEAFLNDYAAACLGDKKFYKKYERKSVHFKLQFIVEHIINTAFDKNEKYVCFIKQLTQDRRDLVHCKSFDITGIGYTESEYEELKESCAESDDTNEWLVDISAYSEPFRMTENGIKAMRELALFFDKNDKNAHAVICFFSPLSNYIQHEKNHPMIRVLQDFEIPTKYKRMR